MMYLCILLRLDIKCIRFIPQITEYSNKLYLNSLTIS